MTALKDYKPGQEVSVPGFVMQMQWSDTPTWHPSELTGSGYTTLCPLTITFQLPATFNATAAELASIDRDLAAAAESYHSTVSSLRSRKQDLLQLTHEATGTSDIMDADTAASPPQVFQDIDDDFPF